MNLQEAQNLKPGQIIYSTERKDASGEFMRAKVLSVKTWKKQPERVQVSVKHGLYEYVKFNENELEQISLTAEPATSVIFRVFKEGDVIAIFPYDIADNQGNVSSYMHIGQHSGATLELIRDTKPAMPEQYADLKAELEGEPYNYNLKVIQKVSYKKYNQAREEIRK